MKKWNHTIHQILDCPAIREIMLTRDCLNRDLIGDIFARTGWNTFMVFKPTQNEVVDTMKLNGKKIGMRNGL